MIDFLKYSKAVLVYTVVVFAASALFGVYRWQDRGSAFSYSVDFTGGTQVLFKFDAPVSSADVKNVLESKGWHGIVMREFPNNELLVRVKAYENDSRGLGEHMRTALLNAMPTSGVTILQTEAVGSGVGAELRTKSMYAVVISLIALLIYIAFSFWSFAYAVGATMALVHDANVMLIFFLLTDREISITVIGAILAVLGYSINDTIVIFSRIRTNVQKMRQVSLAEIINLSINQTLTRTLLTSFATLLTVIAMVIFGGEVLRDFSITLFIGIVCGTYSSIFIASPVMMMLYKEEKATS